MTPPFCEEARLRIRVSVFAWAYETHNVSLVPDAVYDEMARRVDLSKDTSRPDMDRWFRKNFSPHTGMWVLKHPDTQGLERIYRQVWCVSAWELILRKVIGASAPKQDASL